ncbi:RNA ligase family protein [Mitsuaria sp. GD03876]|uniref:RNA ligase family protein n=1 Tax=Mitsuaria sp. GD03876 TaxID=2975399 RepID=UPI002447277D|nr:RNA ligase family protein [Mitsuaria sp. GD03876]MDH0863905.1 RNA ligase family protein [Mitsuaria sp. GD03876]
MHLTSMPLPRSTRAATPSGHGLPLHDDAPESLPLSALAGRHVVIEEALDGAETDLGFDDRGEPLLRSRGQPLAGGFGERPFIPLKIWAMAHEQRLIERLGDRLELHGRWAYAARRVWYDQLPHYFIETDLLDRASGRCLSTPRRQALLAGSPVLSAPVLYAGPMPTHPQWLDVLLARSLARSAHWRAAFEATALREALPMSSWPTRAGGTPPVTLVVKVEEGDHVLARFRLTRADHERPLPLPALLPNALARGADLFAPQPTVTWRDLGLRTVRSLGALRALSVDAMEQRCA